MSLSEIERAVQTLEPDDLANFSRWLEEYLADRWDEQIEADARAGRLHEVKRRADDDFNAGRCTPL